MSVFGPMLFMSINVKFKVLLLRHLLLSPLPQLYSPLPPYSPLKTPNTFLPYMMAFVLLVPLPGYFSPRHLFARLAPFLLLNVTFSERRSLSISFHLTPEVLVFFFTLVSISSLHLSSPGIVQVCYPTGKHRLHLFCSCSFFRYYKRACNIVDFHGV